MSHNYTAAQLTLFRSAIALLAKGVTQDISTEEMGLDNNHADEQRLADGMFGKKTEMSSSEGGALTNQSIQPLSDKSKSEPIFSVLSWFLKPKEEPTANVSVLVEGQNSTEPPVTTATSIVPETQLVNIGSDNNDARPRQTPLINTADKLVGNAASENSLVFIKNHISAKSFFAAVPWFIDRETHSTPITPIIISSLDKNHGQESSAESITKRDNDLDTTETPCNFKSQISNEGQYGVPNDQHLSIETDRNDALIPKVPVASTNADKVADSLAVDKSSVYIQNPISAQAFFAAVPWLENSIKTEPMVIVDSDENQNQALENSISAPTRLDFVIAADKTFDTLRINEEVPVKVYFAGLPWDAKKQQLLPKSTIPLNVENLLSSIDTNYSDVKAKKSNVIDGAFDKENQKTAKIFFSNAAWLQPKNVISISANASFDRYQDGVEHQTVTSLKPQLIKAAQPMADYFQSLPWQRKPVPVITDIHRVSEESHKDVSSIFAAATRSALQAAQNARLDDGLLGKNKIDKFFSSLPWKGNP